MTGNRLENLSFLVFCEKDFYPLHGVHGVHGVRLVDNLVTTQELALRNAELEQLLLQRTFELEVLSELAQQVNYPFSDKELLATLLRSLDRALPIDIAAGIVVGSRDVQVVLHPAGELGTEVEAEIRDRLFESFCLMTGQSMQDFGLDAWDGSKSPISQSYGLRKFSSILGSVLMVPMIVGQSNRSECYETVGILMVGAVKQNVFTQNHLRFLDTVANQGAVSWGCLRSHISAEKKRLENIVTHCSDGFVLIDQDGYILLKNRQAQSILERLAEIDIEQRLRRLGDRPLIEWLSHMKQPPQWQDLSVAASYMASDVQVKVSSTVDARNTYTIFFRENSSDSDFKRLKDELLSVIGHELRTPLTLVYAPLEMLASGQFGALHPEGQNLLDIGIQSAKRLSLLIDQVLDLSQLEAGLVEMQFGFCNVIDQVERAIETIPAKDQRTINLQTEFRRSRDADLVNDCRPWNGQSFTCEADADYIQKVISHLLDNAIKFSESNSPIEIVVFDNIHSVQISVMDQGIGIPQEQLTSIFNCFQQGDSSHCRHYEGMGLGLTICDRIVRQHAGKIWVDSIQQQGSTFHFSLPKEHRNMTRQTTLSDKSFY